MSDRQKSCCPEPPQACCGEPIRAPECRCPDKRELDISSIVRRVNGGHDLYFDRILMI